MTSEPDAALPPDEVSKLDATENIPIEENDPRESSPPNPAEGESAQQPLSKNAMKRLAKEARKAEQKLVWRAREKEKKKLKQAEKRKLREESGADDQPPAKRPRSEHPKKVPFNARVVIDLGFDDKMSVKEVGSLCSQLNHTHSANKRTTRPFADLLMTGLGGRTKERLDGQNDKSYLRWRGVDWWEEGYERLWEGSSKTDGENTSPAAQGAPPPEESELLEGSSQANAKGRDPKVHAAGKDTVVYLTADSENEIAELKEGETYIIGGIVDRNRYKNLCQNKALSQGVRTGRLPIGTYLASMPTRKVLTVNQVFEILVRWVEERDWEKALLGVMPKRKFKDPNANNPQRRKADDERDEGEEDAEGENEDAGEEEEADGLLEEKQIERSGIE